MRLRIIGLVATLALGLLAAPLAADAQPPAKVPRIGVLSGGTRSPNTDAFVQGLRDLGYVDGQNILIEYRWAEGRLQRLPDLAAVLVRLKVDLIFCSGAPGGTSAVRAAKNATATIPIVFAGVGDPVGSGFVASLAHPGGNITGVTSVSLELYGKRLEMLKEAIPGVARVVLLGNPANQSHPSILWETESVARTLGVQLQHVEARDPAELDRAFSAMIRQRAQGLLVPSDPMFVKERARIADLAARSRLPAVYALREHVEAGGLMAYGVHTVDLHRRAAAYVDKILKGARPADLPVEQPTKFELVINLKTAKALGLTIPQSVLIRADKLIE